MSTNKRKIPQKCFYKQKPIFKLWGSKSTIFFYYDNIIIIILLFYNKSIFKLPGEQIPNKNLCFFSLIGKIKYKFILYIPLKPYECIFYIFCFCIVSVAKKNQASLNPLKNPKSSKNNVSPSKWFLRTIENFRFYFLNRTIK